MQDPPQPRTCSQVLEFPNVGRSSVGSFLIMRAAPASERRRRGLWLPTLTGAWRLAAAKCVSVLQAAWSRCQEIQSSQVSTKASGAETVRTEGRGLTVSANHILWLGRGVLLERDIDNNPFLQCSKKIYDFIFVWARRDSLMVKVLALNAPGSHMGAGSYPGGPASHPAP